MALDDDMAMMDDDDGDGDGAAWMATFSDLATLLLTFFVLLLSFANLDVIEFRMMLGSVRDAMGVDSNHPGTYEALSTSPVEFSKNPSSSRLQLMEEMQMLHKVKKAIEDSGMSAAMEAELSERGVVVRVKEAVLFPSASAKMRTGDAHTVLAAIRKITDDLEAKLLVEGHTDNRPIRSTKYPSNWELSAARAIAAMRHLVDEEKLDARRIGVAGYGDQRPVSSNDSAEGRARNRRVEFIFLRDAPRNPNGNLPRRGRTVKSGK